MAHISDTGIVTALQPGETTVTVSSVDGNVRKSCPVTVTEGNAAHKIYVSKSELSLSAGDSLQLESGLSGHPEEGETVLFFSSHPEVATVDGNGTITAHAGGSTVVSAVLSVSGYTAVCNVSVKGIPVESVSHDASELTMHKGERAAVYRHGPARRRQRKDGDLFQPRSRRCRRDVGRSRGGVCRRGYGDHRTDAGREKTARCVLHVVP